MTIIRREPGATIEDNETVISMVLENERGDVVIDSEALDKILAEFEPKIDPIGETFCLGWNGGKLFADRGVLSEVEVFIEAIGLDWVVVRDVCHKRAYAASFPRKMTFKEIKKVLED